MSTRRERRRKAEAGRKKATWSIRLGVGVFVTALVVSGGGYLFLSSWLHGEGFRRTLSEAAGDATRTRASFGIFDWSGTQLQTPSLTADGDSLVRNVDARGLKVDVGLSAAWHGVLQIDDARVRSISVDLDSTAPATKPVTGPLPEATAEKKKTAKWYDRFIPHEVALKSLQVDDSAVSVATKSGLIGFKGMSWKIEPDQQRGSYQARAAGGKLTLPGKNSPPMQLGVARLRYADDSIYLTDADLRVYDSGRLDLTGEMSLKGNGYHFEGDLQDVRCAEVLYGDWKKRIEGTLSSNFTVRNPSGQPEIDGKLNVSDAVMTALPLLDALSAYADTTRFRRMALQEARCNYNLKDGNLHLSQMVISAEGLVRLEGSLTIDASEQIDGMFRIGLVPGVLSQIPGAETEVFLPGERQLLWTTLHITGTLDHPKEDLTDRLVAAAGARMFDVIPETGEKVLKFSHTLLSKELPDAIQKGVDAVGPEAIQKGREVLGQGREVIDQGKDILHQAKGLADDVGDLVGGLTGKEPKPKKEPPPPRKGDDGH